jgi:pimeloyl-ACP methyl ester carboxylesterase
MRGFGETSAPDRVDDYTMLHSVGDVIGVLDALDLRSAVLIGHDWGAPVVWNAALMRPDRVRAVAGLSVPYTPRSSLSTTEAMRARNELGFYMLYFQQPDIPEAEFEKDIPLSLRRMFYSLSGNPPEAERWRPMVPAGQTFIGSLSDTDCLPSWLTQDELDVYVKAYRRSGFRGGFNWYRNVDRNTALLAPFDAARISVPAMYIGGKRDAVVSWSARSIDNLSDSLGDWRGTILLEKAGHWVQQEAPEEVNEALLNFVQTLK